MNKRNLLIQDTIGVLRKKSKNFRLDLSSLLEDSISLNELFILRFLLENNNPRVSNIADYLQISRALCTVLCDKLFEKELIMRQRSMKDRRIVYISITEKGKNTLNELEGVITSYYKAKFRDFTNEEIEKFIYLLDKVSK